LPLNFQAPLYDAIKVRQVFQDELMVNGLMNMNHIFLLLWRYCANVILRCMGHLLCVLGVACAFVGERSGADWARDSRGAHRARAKVAEGAHSQR
jgi:hypothetical protein